MILNVGCGGEPHHRASMIGDIRLDLEKFPHVTIIADAHNLPFKREIFDSVFSFEVLEHLESPIKALREFKRVLKKEGTITVTIPNVWYWRKIFRCWLGQYFSRYKGLHAFGADHKQAWDIYEFERLSYQVGLKLDYVDWLDWYNLSRSKQIRTVEFLIRLALPKHLRYTHTLLKLRHMGDE